MSTDSGQMSTAGAVLVVPGALWGRGGWGVAERGPHMCVQMPGSSQDNSPFRMLPRQVFLASRGGEGEPL